MAYVMDLLDAERYITQLEKEVANLEDSVRLVALELDNEIEARRKLETKVNMLVSNFTSNA